jgi:hypothetical protein
VPLGPNGEALGFSVFSSLWAAVCSFNSTEMLATAGMTRSTSGARLGSAMSISFCVYRAKFESPFGPVSPAGWAPHLAEAKIGAAQIAPIRLCRVLLTVISGKPRKQITTHEIGRATAAKGSCRNRSSRPRRRDVINYCGDASTASPARTAAPLFARN